MGIRAPTKIAPVTIPIGLAATIKPENNPSAVAQRTLGRALSSIKTAIVTNDIAAAGIAAALARENQVTLGDRASIAPNASPPARPT